jgi:hypothetical protein
LLSSNLQVVIGGQAQKKGKSRHLQFFLKIRIQARLCDIHESDQLRIFQPCQNGASLIDHLFAAGVSVTEHTRESR